MKYFRVIKLSFFLFLIGCICIIPLGCSEDEEGVGSVSGFVRDERGNTLHTVDITLFPGGRVTSTGTNGHYEFTDLKPQVYSIKAEKSGYKQEVRSIIIEDSQSAPGDITLKDGTGYLKLDETELNFGKNNDALAFTVKNTGQDDVNWKIDNVYNWIKKIEPLSGTLKIGENSSVTVTIDRSQLQSGKTKEVSLIITSNSGADCITIKATGDDGKGSGTDPGGSTQPNLSAGLLAHYTFDNQNADDATRNENHANIINSCSFDEDTPSGKGKAIFLNGNKNQFVNIPINFFKGLNSYSFSLWIKDFGQGVLIAAVSSENLSSSCPRLVAGQNGNFYFYTYHAVNSFPYKYNLIQDGKWHMITVVYEHIKYATSENKLYVDGRLVSTQEETSYSYSTPQIQIGGNCNGLYNSNSSSMLVDEVRFYNRCLTDSDIKYLYQQELE